MPLEFLFECCAAVNNQYSRAARLVAELVGSALLLATVVGSGIMAEQLAAGNSAVALIANTLATVFGLILLIELFGPISGAHFNPVVTLLMRLRKQLTTTDTFLYIAMQCAGAALGVLLVHFMFDQTLLQFSSKVRTGPGIWMGEVIATFGLILAVLRAPANRASLLIACWIGAAYWFTSSTSFANPVAVLGRSLSNSFAGIAPSSAIGFIIAQLIGATLAYGLHQWIERNKN